jgi:hypothetical protein
MGWIAITAFALLPDCSPSPRFGIIIVTHIPHWTGRPWERRAGLKIFGDILRKRGDMRFNLC